MVLQKSTIRTYVQNVTDIITKTDIIAEGTNLAEIIRERFLDMTTYIKDGVIRVTLLGEYSSGKSALLNAILGGKYLAENILKETAVETKVRYSTKEEERYTYRKSSDKSLVSVPYDFSKKPFSTQELGDDVSEVCLYINAPKLQEYEQLSIFFSDTPGINTSDEVHENIIVDATIKAHVFLLCVPANKGTISDVLLAKAKAVVSNKKVIGVVTKCNLPDITDGGKEFANLMTKNIESAIGSENLLGIVCTDAKTPNITELQTQLMSLDEHYFVKHFFLNLAKEQKNNLSKEIDAIISILDTDSKTAEAAINDANSQVKTITDKFNNEKEQLKKDIIAQKTFICNDIVNALIDKANNIKSETDARSIATNAALQSFNNHIKPLLERFAKNLSMPNNSIAIPLDTSDIAKELSNIFTAVGGLATALSTIISSSTLGPIGIVLASLGALFSSLFGDSAQAKISKQLTSSGTRAKIEAQIKIALEQFGSIIETHFKEKIKNDKERVDFLKLVEKQTKTKEDKEKLINDSKALLLEIEQLFTDLQNFANSK